MSIVIFLILLASSMSNGDAAENSNKEEIVYRQLETSPEIPVFRKKRSTKVGGEMDQDPNNPEFQAMAADLVYKHLHINREDTEKIKVNRVTTQVVAGSITRIQFQVVFNNGRTLSCSSQIWEQSWKHFKDVSYQCTESN